MYCYKCSCTHVVFLLLIFLKLDNRGSESPPRGHSAPNMNNNATLLLANSPAALESPYVDDPEALIAGLQRNNSNNNDNSNGEIGAGDGANKKKKKKVKKSNTVERTIENRLVISLLY